MREFGIRGVSSWFDEANPCAVNDDIQGAQLGNGRSDKLLSCSRRSEIACKNGGVQPEILEFIFRAAAEKKRVSTSCKTPRQFCSHPTRRACNKNIYHTLITRPDAVAMQLLSRTMNQQTHAWLVSPPLCRKA